MRKIEKYQNIQNHRTFYFELTHMKSHIKLWRRCVWISTLKKLVLEF